ncbi:MAG: hypothetical protein ACRYHQ_12210 [Janthinobacterium lividum]
MDSLQTLTAFGALAVVLGLVWLGARGVRAAGLARPGGGRRLQLREALALDRTRRLHLVACDGRDLLLLTGGGADVVVAWLPARETRA